MTSIMDIVNFLEKEITEVGNSIEKVSVISSLTGIIELITEENIWDFSKADLEKLQKSLTKQKSLTTDEIDVLEGIVDLPIELKKFKKTIGLSEEQKIIINTINEKIKEYQQSQIINMDVIKLEKMVNKYKLVMNKLKNHDMFVITEIDIIADIMKKYNIPFSEQIIIYREINKINNEIFSNYNISLDTIGIEDEEILDESNLVETNLPKEMLEIIFSEFNIEFKINCDENTSDEDKKNKELKIASYIEILLKYGDFNKMRDILLCLKQNNLEFIFTMPEILTSTLLYSSREKIEYLIKKGKENNIDMYKAILNKPALLYPTIRTLDFKIKKQNYQPGPNNKTTTGALKYFTDCVEFLESHNYNVNEVYEKCEIIFYSPIKTIKRAYESLIMYGINSQEFKSGDGFSVLTEAKMLDKLDIAIECGVFEYTKDNLSTVKRVDKSPYKIKLAKSEGLPNNEIFGMRGSKLVVRSGFAKYDSYGKRIKDYFEKYKAYTHESPYKEMYDNIIKESDNNEISTISVKNSLIEKLDSMYKPKDDDRVYIFDGIIISRYKVLRYYQTLISNPSITPNKDVLMYVITHLSMLTKEEYDTIESCVNKIKFKERVLV